MACYVLHLSLCDPVMAHLLAYTRICNSMQYELLSLNRQGWLICESQPHKNKSADIFLVVCQNLLPSSPSLPSFYLSGWYSLWILPFNMVSMNTMWHNQISVIPWIPTNTHNVDIYTRIVKTASKSQRRWRSMVQIRFGGIILHFHRPNFCNKDPRWRHSSISKLIGGRDYFWQSVSRALWPVMALGGMITMVCFKSGHIAGNWLVSLQLCNKFPRCCLQESIIISHSAGLQASLRF